MADAGKSKNNMSTPSGVDIITTERIKQLTPAELSLNGQEYTSNYPGIPDNRENVKENGLLSTLF